MALTKITTLVSNFLSTDPLESGGLRIDGGNLYYHDGTSEQLATGGFTDVKDVKVTTNDTTPKFLKDCFVAGTNITITELNDGLNETLEFAGPGGGGSGVNFTAAALVGATTAIDTAGAFTVAHTLGVAPTMIWCNYSTGAGTNSEGGMGGMGTAWTDGGGGYTQVCHYNNDNGSFRPLSGRENTNSIMRWEHLLGGHTLDIQVTGADATNVNLLRVVQSGPGNLSPYSPGHFVFIFAA